MGYDRNRPYSIESASDNWLYKHCTCHDPCTTSMQMHIDDNIHPCQCAKSETPDCEIPECHQRDRIVCHPQIPEHEKCDCDCDCARSETQLHVHEIQGSVELAEWVIDAHNHRFATVTEEARYIGSTHVHNVRFRTDYTDDHYHEAWGTTGPAIQVGDSHVHFLYGITTLNDEHLHRYRVATMIEDPIR